MKTAVLKIKCKSKNGITGTFFTDENGVELTKVYKNAYDLFMSDEYNNIKNNFITK